MAHGLKDRTTAELLALVTDGVDPSLFAEATGELVLRYKNVIYAQALAACGSQPALADDVFQETFVRVFGWLKKRDRQPVHSFARLLQVFSRRAAIDLLRKGGRVPLATEPPAQPDPDLSLYIQQLLERLDARSAEVIRLSYLEGRSAKEVAVMLGLTAGNVRILRYRALEAIRAQHVLDDYADKLEAL